MIWVEVMGIYCVMGDLNGWVEDRVRIGYNKRMEKFCAKKWFCLGNEYFSHKYVHKYTRKTTCRKINREQNRFSVGKKRYAKIRS